MRSSTDLARELEQTRARMSAEFDALSYKFDMPSRAKERVGAATRRVRSAAPSADDVKSTAHDNPLGVVLGGVAVGLLAGLMLPRTRIEDEKVGPIADRVRDEAVSAGREAATRAKSVARQAGEAAKDAATKAGERQGEALKQTATSRARRAASSAR